MKYILTITLLLFTLSSCKEAYETLSTPFKHVGKGLGYIGPTVIQPNKKSTNISEKKIQNSIGAYEIEVKAPPGSVINTAISLFHKEARKTCGGATYKHKITYKGSSNHTSISRSATDSPIVPKTQITPTVKGIIICNDALPL